MLNAEAFLAQFRLHVSLAGTSSCCKILTVVDLLKSSVASHLSLHQARRQNLEKTFLVKRLYLLKNSEVRVLKIDGLDWF